MSTVSINYSRWHRLLAGIVVGVLVSLLCYLFIPAKYEATSLIEIGRVAGRGQIETLPSLIARMRALSTLQAVARRSNLPQTDRETDRLLANTKLGAGGEYLEIRAAARVQAEAIHIVEAYVAEVNQQHEAMVQAIVSDLRAQIRETETRIDGEEKALQSTFARDKHSDADFLMLAQGQATRSALLAQELSLNNMLRQPTSSPTILAVPIAVSEKTVFPSVALLIGLGIASGAFVSISLIWGRRLLGLS